MWVAAVFDQFHNGDAVGRDILLGEQAELPGEFLRAQFLDVRPVETNGTGIEAELIGKTFQRRALTAAVRSY